MGLMCAGRSRCVAGRFVVACLVLTVIASGCGGGDNNASEAPSENIIDRLKTTEMCELAGIRGTLGDALARPTAKDAEETSELLFYLAESDDYRAELHMIAEGHAEWIEKIEDLNLEDPLTAEQWTMVDAVRASIDADELYVAAQRVALNHEEFCFS